jgi:hypothetical protein
MTPGRPATRIKLLNAIFLLVVVALGLTVGPAAWAAESGTGLYLLGYQSSLAGYLPDPGLYFKNDFYWYQGNAKVLAFSGRIEADLRNRAIFDLFSLTCVTKWKILGANYALGAIGSMGNVFLKGKLTSPGIPVPPLNSQTVTREGDFTSMGDLVVSPLILGWHLGNFHIMGMGNFYAPTGNYNKDRRLNVGLNRWAIEPNVAVTWLQPKYGQEVSLSLGYTVNFENPATQYRTGNEFHLEYFLGQHLPKGFALGLAGYLYQQVTADSGPGARLGAFHGQSLALGPCLTFNGKLAGHAIGLNARYYNELKVINRLDGQSFFLTLSLGI